ncbi:unnamed protein product [Owenia fusiformis]|uniref:Uncharacterized protein n=1 Tax=Owenia fusiformis TaxID=6347 RepID=A0A8J1TJC1_OWEFU|nr:unnamed protein product [Owenia fusiformis]
MTSFSIIVTSCKSWRLIAIIVVIGGVPVPEKQIESKCRPFSEFLLVKKDGSVRCHACSRCPVGKCVETHCSGYINTKCRTPEANEYLAGDVCMPCTDCGNRRIVQLGCSSNSDTKCGGCKSEYYWDEMVEECIPIFHETESDTTAAHPSHLSTLI